MKCENRKVVHLAAYVPGVFSCLCKLCRPKERKLSWPTEGKLLLICYEYFCCLSHISGMGDQPEINMQLNSCEKDNLIIF